MAQRSEDIRELLAQEIAGKEEELKALKHALADLDAAIKAANAAREAASSVRAVSTADKAREAARQERESTLQQGMVIERKQEAPRQQEQPNPSPAPKPAPKPAPEPVAPPPTPLHVHWPTPAGKYANMKVWKAIQDLLTEHRASMSVEEITAELEKGGAHLGDNPVRTVSAAISYMNDKIFHVSKSGGRTMVSVLRPSEF